MTTPTHLSRLRTLAEQEARNRKSSRTKKDKSNLMTLHLQTVEKVAGRLDPLVLRSEKFTKSRDEFVRLMWQWLP